MNKKATLDHRASHPGPAPSALTELLQQFIDYRFQSWQRVFNDVSNRVVIYPRITMNELVSERHDLRQVGNAGGASPACALSSWFSASPMISNFRSTAE